MNQTTQPPNTTQGIYTSGKNQNFPITYPHWVELGGVNQNPTIRLLKKAKHNTLAVIIDI
jgi:alcohol dehydrogenase YqhD (iron-dependent ADH family)